MAQALGALAFTMAIAPAGADDRAARTIGSLARWSIGVAIASWLAWLVLQASAMAGVSIAAALAPATLARVAAQTAFGRAWLVRLGLLAVVALLLARRRPRRGALATDGVAATLVAAIATATLAETGHAAAAIGVDRPIRIGADAMHALAAGTWLGALWPLAIALRSTSDPHRMHAIARRFSIVGIACVVTLIVTGIVNGVYLVGSWPALFGTRYGELLVAKLALFAAMLALAASNRLRATPGLARADSNTAAAHIVRNARAEAALGAAILAIVAALGVTVPAAHDEVRWPFGFRIAFDAGRASIVSAFPTTYARPPVRYDVSSVARGAAVYAAHCASCHESDGRGERFAAGTTAPAPLAAAHVRSHRDGDLYWWITHGIAGTRMPAFEATLDERARWDVVHFVVTLAAAAVLDTTNAAAHRIAAPQFTYQIDRRPQQAIGTRNASATLLVLYTLPQSRERLLALASDLPQFARARMRVAAVPMHETDTHADADPRIATIAATTSKDTVPVYRLFAAHAPHAEFLIGSDGRLRARWDAIELPAPAAIVRDFGSAPAATADAGAAEHDHAR